MVRRLSTALRSSALSASVLCAFALAAIPLLSACGGDATVKAGNSTASASGSASAANDTKNSPTLKMPVSRFAIDLNDLGSAFITNVPDTYVLDATQYGHALTPQSEDGVNMLKDWGYEGGYETAFRPEGESKAVLQQGAYYVTVETHLFQSDTGAKKMYDYFVGYLKGATPPVASEPLGNESSGYKFLSGTITNSTVRAADHRFIFRRGNLVTIVKTLGADPSMEASGGIKTVRALAQIVDDKATGKRNAIEPTPTSNFTPSSGIPNASPAAGN